tara:strand:- start:55 stop:327 length:273 start_codon:yes stop_codon:yes gene_type:complete
MKLMNGRGSLNHQNSPENILIKIAEMIMFFVRFLRLNMKININKWLNKQALMVADGFAGTTSNILSNNIANHLASNLHEDFAVKLQHTAA